MGRTIADPRRRGRRRFRRQAGRAPNVLFIVLDDTGFSQLGCYGSPINTPNINKLAQNGLLYTNMHTTALCSPTRSCILTGAIIIPMRWRASRKARRVILARTAQSRSRNGFSVEMLLGQGYNTYAFGKCT